MKKEHIINNTDIDNQFVLCGRDGSEATGSKFVKFLKKYNWCKTCKKLYNANFAKSKKELLK